MKEKILLLRRKIVLGRKKKGDTPFLALPPSPPHLAGEEKKRGVSLVPRPA